MAFVRSALFRLNAQLRFFFRRFSLRLLLKSELLADVFLLTFFALPGPPLRREQDLETLDPSVLTPLTPEVISRQATINIGTIGHVAHGKSTVVKAISGVQVRWHVERWVDVFLGGGVGGGGRAGTALNLPWVPMVIVFGYI